MPEIHTIYVPAGWSVEQVWEAIRRDDRILVNGEVGSWVNVDEDGKLVVEPEEE